MRVTPSCLSCLAAWKRLVRMRGMWSPPPMDARRTAGVSPTLPFLGMMTASTEVASAVLMGGGGGWGLYEGDDSLVAAGLGEGVEASPGKELDFGTSLLG
jgi:hypothetical protein